jgi:hypothetical protein
MEKKISKEIGKRKIVFLSLRGVVYGYVYYISLSQCGIDAVTIESLESLIPMIQKSCEQEFGCKVNLVRDERVADEVYIIPECADDLVCDYIRHSFREAGELSGEAYALCPSETKESLLKYDVSEISADVFNEFGKEFTYDDFLALGVIELWESSFKTMSKSVADLDEEPSQIASFKCSHEKTNPYMSCYEENVFLCDGGQSYAVCLHCGRKITESFCVMGWHYCKCCGNALLALWEANKYDACPAKKRLIYRKYEEWKKENGYEDRPIKELADFQKEYILNQMDLSETYYIKGHGQVKRISLPQNIFEIIDEDIEMAIRSFMQNMETAKGEKILVWFVANVDRMLLYEIYVPGQRKHYERPVDAIPF